MAAVRDRANRCAVLEPATTGLQRDHLANSRADAEAITRESDDVDARVLVGASTVGSAFGQKQASGRMLSG